MQASLEAWLRDGAPAWLSRPAALVERLLGPRPWALALQLFRYGVTSGTALVADLALFVCLLWAGLMPTLAGFLSFAVGVAVHYAIGTRFVFDTSRVTRSRTQLFAEYAAAGISGAVVTTVVIAVATSSAVGLPPLAAKILAVGLNFLVVFTMLRKVVFRSDVAAG